MEQPGKRSTVVVGVDGSAPSILALRWASIIAPLRDAEIRPVTAWDFEIPFGRLTPVVSNPDQVAQRVCSETAIKAFGSMVVAVDRSGSAAPLKEACTVASVTGANLTVVHV